MIAALLALAPALPLHWASDRELAKSRDTWLLIVLGVGGIWYLKTDAPWLALMATWFSLRWRSQDLVKHLVTWCGIGGSWHLLRGLPPLAWDWLPYIWTAILLVHVGLVLDQKLRKGIGRPWGVLGSPPICAMVLALLGPFAFATHWTLALPLLAGLWLTSSWLAVLATLVGTVVLFPALILPAGVTMAVIGMIIALELARYHRGVARGADGQVIRRWLDWMPRGRSVDGFRVRVNVWRVVWHVWRQEGLWRWVKGRGPGMMNPAMQRWSFRYDVKLAEGDAFNDPLQHVHEYGLLGLLALAAFCWPILGHLQWGDPYSAAWIVGIVLSLGHWPMRWPTTGVMWLAIGARLA